jgi:hypothetical protein
VTVSRRAGVIINPVEGAFTMQATIDQATIRRAMDGERNCYVDWIDALCQSAERQYAQSAPRGARDGWDESHLGQDA